MAEFPLYRLRLLAAEEALSATIDQVLGRVAGNANTIWNVWCEHEVLGSFKSARLDLTRTGGVRV
jgi:hypothetical protein